MRILILTHSYPDANQLFRGVFVREQVQALSATDEIILVYFKTDYTRTAPFRKYRFNKKTSHNLTEYEVTTSKSFPVINQLKYILNTYSFIKNEILVNQKIDLVHSHLAYPAGILGTIVSNRRNIPSVLTEHTSIVKYYRSFIHKLCVKYALKKSYEVICVSRALREEVLNVIRRHVVVIPNVIDTSQFHLVREKHDKINIGFLGSLNNRNKGLDLLLQAISSIDKINIRVYIGGKGNLEDEFIRQAEQLNLADICTFYGGILPEKRQEFYSKLDMFILPSRYETFGIVIVEAMACGIPVISTKCGGPEDIITEETGILVQKNNVNDLADAIKKMIQNLPSYNKDEIRKYAEENFGKDIFVKRIKSLYQEITIKWQNRKHSQKM